MTHQRVLCKEDEGVGVVGLKKFFYLFVCFVFKIGEISACLHVT